MKYLILLILLTNVAFSAVIEKRGEEFAVLKNPFTAKELLLDYGRLMNKNVSVYPDFQDEEFEVFGKKTLTKEQIEGFLSRVLSISGSMMIVDPAVPYIQVLEGRDARYSTLPVYDDLNAFPDNDNFVQFNFRLKHAEPRDMARNMRPFLSRYGRVIDVPHARSIHLADTGSNIKRLVAMAKIIDVESYDKDKKEIEAINDKHRKVLKNEKSLVDILIENNGIFLVVFMVLGLIIGFGVRGYMMKRIEGGW